MFWIVVKQKGLRDEFSQRCEKEELRKSAGRQHALGGVINIYPHILYHMPSRLSRGKYYTGRVVDGGRDQGLTAFWDLWRRKRKIGIWTAEDAVGLYLGELAVPPSGHRHVDIELDEILRE